MVFIVIWFGLVELELEAQIFITTMEIFYFFMRPLVCHSAKNFRCVHPYNICKQDS